jgi:hypothetical protein
MQPGVAQTRLGGAGSLGELDEIIVVTDVGTRLRGAERQPRRTCPGSAASAASTSANCRAAKSSSASSR